MAHNVRTVLQAKSRQQGQTGSAAAASGQASAASDSSKTQRQAASRAAAAAAKQHLLDPAVNNVCRTLGAAKEDTKQQTLGILLFAALVFAAGAATWCLPWLFVLFAVVCLPWRVYSFWKQKWAFYLMDFCYFVNVAVVIFLLWYPNSLRLEALAYALADGPLAGALVAWQCPWVFGSSVHTTSVLMHLLPGLAVFAHRYATPIGLRGWRGLSSSVMQLVQGNRPSIGSVPAAAHPDRLAVWLIASPLLFYVTWQLLYFFIVQVLMRSFILKHGYETSYTCLARRAAKTNNFWNRLVRRGSIMRRITMYGLLQLAFTVICCALFLPTYFSYWMAVLFQIIKVAFPVYYGARYQCQKVPQHVFLRGIQQLDAAKAAEASAAATVAPAGVHGSSGKPGERSTLHLRSCAFEAAAAYPQTTPVLQRPIVA